MSRLVTLHVWRVPPAALPRALWRMAVDRRRLTGTPGVSFSKLLGTGRDLRFGPADADLTRWAALTVWDAAPARDGPVDRAWAGIATARCRLTLRAISSRGEWSGRAPFEPAGRVVSGAPVLALTRARLRPTRAIRFWRTIPTVGDRLPGAPGLLAAFGIGEAPLGWQGTVSVWRDPASLVGFAYRQPEHRAAVDATPVRRWYAEELFARFTVLDVDGDRDVLGWRGRDDRV